VRRDARAGEGEGGKQDEMSKEITDHPAYPTQSILQGSPVGRAANRFSQAVFVCIRLTPALE